MMCLSVLIFINYILYFVWVQKAFGKKRYLIGINALIFQIFNLIFISIIILVLILVVILMSILVTILAFILIDFLVFILVNNLLFTLVHILFFILDFFLIINIVFGTKLITLKIQIYYDLLFIYKTQSILRLVQSIFFIIIMGNDMLLYKDNVNIYYNYFIFI